MPKLTRKRLLLATAASAVLLALSIRYLVRRTPTPEERVVAWVEMLQRPVGRAHPYHVALWKRLPVRAADWLADFAPPNPQSLRISALAELAAAAPQSDSVVAAVTAALEDPSLQNSAIEALKSIGPFAQGAIDPLIHIADSDPNNTGEQAFAALVRIAPADHRTLDLCFRRLDPKHEGVWYSTALAMASCAPAYNAAIRSKLLFRCTEEPQLLPVLFRTIAKIEPSSEASRQFILEALRQSGFSLQQQAINLLIQEPRSDPGIAAELLNVLQDFKPIRVEDSWIRQRYPDRQIPDRRVGPVRALGKMGPSAQMAEPWLRPLVVETNRLLRLESAIALRRITSDSGPVCTVLSDFLESESEETRRLAATHFNELEDDPSCIPLLRRAIKNPDNKVRYQAVDALARLGPAARETLPDVRSLFSDPSFLVRSSASNFVSTIENMRTNRKSDTAGISK